MINLKEEKRKEREREREREREKKRRGLIGALGLFLFSFGNLFESAVEQLGSSLFGALLRVKRENKKEREEEKGERVLSGLR